MNEQIPMRDPANMPSRFLNFVISLIPGAGQMYLGFLQRGVILMAFFSCCITLLAFFDGFGRLDLMVGLSSIGIIISYFYSFFDSMRLCRLMRSGMLPADLLGTLDLPGELPTFNFKKRGTTLLGVLLTLIGATGVISVVVDRYVSYEIVQLYLLPALEIAVPLAFLIAGIALLLKGKREKATANDQLDPAV